MNFLKYLKHTYDNSPKIISVYYGLPLAICLIIGFSKPSYLLAQNANTWFSIVFSSIFIALIIGTAALFSLYAVFGDKYNKSRKNTDL